MSHGEFDCLDCGNPFNEFSDTDGFMACPNAGLSYDAILKLMPQFGSEDEMKEAIMALKKGGYRISSTFYDGKKTKNWSPLIPVIQELAERLMEYEEVNGARYHSSRIVCKTCADRQSHCSHCGHDHKPTCRICGAELVPLE